MAFGIHNNAVEIKLSINGQFCAPAQHYPLSLNFYIKYLCQNLFPQS